MIAEPETVHIVLVGWLAVCERSDNAPRKSGRTDATPPRVLHGESYRFVKRDGIYFCPFHALVKHLMDVY